jgi:hypothetical protein
MSIGVFRDAKIMGQMEVNLSKWHASRRRENRFPRIVILFRMPITTKRKRKKKKKGKKKKKKKKKTRGKLDW